MMQYVFGLWIFAAGVLAVYIATQFLLRNKKTKENVMFSLCCFSSGIWSFGFAGIILQTSVEYAYYFRCFGMVGVFALLILAQFFISSISHLPKIGQIIFNGFSLLGIPIYFLISQKGEVEFFLDDMGMTYRFRNGLPGSLYTGYCVIVGANLLIAIFYMHRHVTLNREKVFCRRYFMVAVIIIFGMVLDTVFPLIGKPAIPGSTITQFFGVLVLCQAVSSFNKTQITVSNMSGFVYYSLSMPVLVYDSNYSLRIMNDAAGEFFGVDREQAEKGNMHIPDLFTIEEYEVFAFEESRKSVDAVCHENNLYCSLDVSKIHDQYGDVIGYIIMVTDLSDRIREMLKLEEAKYAADAANRSKSAFLANMSHEIRTPMNAIIGFAELLHETNLDGKAREYVEDIQGASQSLLAIINDILDISKIESGKMELVCSEYYTASLFSEVYLIIQSQAKKKGLMFEMDVDPFIPNKILGDKARVRGVLINLLNNAVKYTKEGSVGLKAYVKERYDKYVVLEFEVWDTGVGIQVTEIPTIFDSFSQADQRVNYGIEGTGLGLAIVKGYVTLMDGEVSVESMYGEGSTFKASIKQEVVDASPLDKSFAKEDTALSDYRIGKIKIQNTRVLLVDDNEVNLKVGRCSLGYYGLDVDVAMSGAQAIKMCRVNHYAIVFMDQMMPQMNGTEAMHQIRNLDEFYALNGPGKIVALTANVISGVREQLLTEGFDAYLGKPMNYRQLEEILLSLISKDRVTICEEKEDKEPVDERVLTIKEMLPMVEVENGLYYCNEDVDNYLKILQIMYKASTTQIKQLKEYHKHKAYRDYAIVAHGIKGSCRNIGANDLGDLAFAHEMAGKELKENFISEHVEEFCENFAALCREIEKVLEVFQLQNKEKKDKKENGEKDSLLLSCLSEMKVDIDSFDFASVSKQFRILDDMKIPESIKDSVDELRKQNDALEYEKMGEILNNCIEKIQRGHPC